MVPKSPKSPKYELGRHGEVKTPWRAFRWCSLWLLRVHWSDHPGLGTSNFSCEKGKESPSLVVDQSLCIWSRLFRLGQQAGLLVTHHHHQCHKAVSEGFSTCVSYLLNQCNSDLLKILTMLKHTHFNQQMQNSVFTSSHLRKKCVLPASWTCYLETQAIFFASAQFKPLLLSSLTLLRILKIAAGGKTGINTPARACSHG